MNEYLEKLAKLVRDTRTDALFGDEVDGYVWDPAAEQQFLAALSYLELAERHLKLAGLSETARIGAMRMR